MPTDLKGNFPELFNFLAGYFHQDWEGTPESVVGRFIADALPETRRSTIAELDRLLGQFATHEEMSRAYSISVATTPLRLTARNHASGFAPCAKCCVPPSLDVEPNAQTKKTARRRSKK